MPVVQNTAQAILSHGQLPSRFGGIRLLGGKFTIKRHGTAMVFLRFRFSAVKVKNVAQKPVCVSQ